MASPAEEDRARPTGDAPAPAEGWERAQALALLLPALVLAWPAWPSPIARDHATVQLTATGAAAFLTLPAAALLLARAARGWRAAQGAAPVILMVLAVAALGALLAGSDGDPLERRRALSWMATGAVGVLAGASLGPAGRRTLAHGASAIALLLMGVALSDGARGYAGALHNTGAVAYAALPGALAGLGVFAGGRGAWRWLGALAFVGFLLHAVVAPVLAALVTTALVCGAAAVCMFRRDRARVAAPALATAALLALAGLAWVLAAPGGDAGPAPTRAAAAQPGGDLGGVAVRRSVWSRSLSLFAAHPLLGVGPGQFAVEFPPYRDPREIDASSLGRRLDAETEVEHPHNDHLLALVEGGLIGALAWGLFVGLALLAAARRAREGRDLDVALGATGLLVAALFHAPFSFDAAASVQGFALIGALLGGTAARRPGFERALAASVGLAFLITAWDSALRLSRHGLALAAIARDGASSPHAVRVGLDAALEACPASVTARTLHARYLEQTGAPRDEVVAAWEAVLALRPHRVEALVQLGVQRALEGETDAARELFERAAALDPGHPALARNRVRLEMFAGELEAGLARLDDAEQAGALEGVWLRDLGAELLCAGLDREAEPLLARADPRLAGLDAQRALQFAREFKTRGSARAAEGFECQADRLWAREHAEEGRWGDARRMLRQVLRYSRDAGDPGSPRVRAELAAAMWRSSRVDEAREELASLTLDANDWAAIPDWARDALLEAEFVAPR